jgi:hypothetical protein
MDGRCRLLCKDNENSIIRCPDRKRCCVPSQYLTIQPITIDGIVDLSTAMMSAQAPTKKKKRNHG